MRVVTLSLLLCWPTYVSAGESLFLADEGLQLYHNDTRTCAVSSMFYLLKELGREKSLREIQMNIEIDENGSNAAQIGKYLEELDIPYIALKTSNLNTAFSLIYPGKRAAILHLDNEPHFILLKKKDDGSPIAFDGTSLIHENVEETLTQRFSGFLIMAGENAKWMFYSPLIAKRILLFLLFVMVGFAFGRLYRNRFRSST